MPENQQSQALQDIRHSLDAAISQLTIYNLYIDYEKDDSHFSNCLISLGDSLEDIAKRLSEYQDSTAIAPSVNLEVSTDGN